MDILEKEKLNKKLLIPILLLVYLGVGIFSICYTWTNDGFSHLYCGLIILLSSLVHILLFFIKDGYKNSQKSFFAIIGIVGFTLGLVFTLSDIDMPNLCLFMGILDIVRSSFELNDCLKEVKEDKFELIELCISIGDIVLGVLLCVEREHGLPLHLTYLGVAFLISFIKVLLLTYFIKEKKE